MSAISPSLDAGYHIYTTQTGIGYTLWQWIVYVLEILGVISFVFLITACIAYYFGDKIEEDPHPIDQSKIHHSKHSYSNDLPALEEKNETEPELEKSPASNPHNFKYYDVIDNNFSVSTKTPPPMSSQRHSIKFPRKLNRVHTTSSLCGKDYYPHGSLKILLETKKRFQEYGKKLQTEEKALKEEEERLNQNKKKFWINTQSLEEEENILKEKQELFKITEEQYRNNKEQFAENRKKDQDNKKPEIICNPPLQSAPKNSINLISLEALQSVFSRDIASPVFVVLNKAKNTLIKAFLFYNPDHDIIFLGKEKTQKKIILVTSGENETKTVLSHIKDHFSPFSQNDIQIYCEKIKALDSIRWEIKISLPQKIKRVVHDFLMKLKQMLSFQW
jgi:hypothetical protein